MEINPNLSLEEKQTILGEGQNGLEKLNAVLAVAETEEPTKKARHPLVSNIISGAPFLIEVIDKNKNEVPKNKDFSFDEKRLVRKGFKPVATERVDLSKMKHEVIEGDNLETVLTRTLET